ncbi:MAG: L-seryl-tRNA(Sec) selenium transferase [Polyangiaceae bacterium]
MSSADLSKLPRVDRVVANGALERARTRLGTRAVTDLARRAIGEARRRARDGEAAPSEDDVAQEVARGVEEALLARGRRVINATGVVLHTNLGRAPLSAAAVEALRASAGGYTSIEIDLATGRRGARGAFAESALATLSGAEDALVVNNNAAAVLLVLSALALGRSVLVSRSELIEIGGGFRVPDVLARSGARMIEVGTTNRTRIDDYAEALDAAGDVAAILRVHQGNFRQIGFVERPPLPALAKLAHERGVLLVKDLGGGALVDLTSTGIAGEPTPRACIEAGTDVVCFSTDKVLGGPQGGAIVGRADLVAKARRDPLARAVRLGRLPLVALEATLAAYLEGTEGTVPAVAAIRAPLESLRARASSWSEALAARGVAARVLDLPSVVGGGAYAEESLASAGLALDLADPDAVATRLRAGTPPVVARIERGALLFDARTVLPGEDGELLEAIAAACR